MQDKETEKWLVDRSRHTEGLQHCQMSRYLKYHSGPQGIGIVSKGFAIPLWTGSTTHLGLEYICKAHIGLDKPLSKAEIRPLINQALEESKAEALSKGFEDEPTEDQAYILEEQLALAEGLLWGFTRACLEKLLQDYEIVKVEEEMPLDLEGTNIRLMTRPDMIVRNRVTGQLGLLDWKSHAGSSIGDSTINEYRNSPQMASGVMAAEKNLGEPVEFYTMYFLLKGSRDYFESRGRKSQTKCQYSHLIYAKFTPASPPLNDTLFENKGFWIDKQPAWKQEFSQAEEGASPMETYIYLLPMELLYEQFLEVGPYPKNEFMSRQFLKTLAGEEIRWQRNMAAISGWDSTPGGTEQQREDFLSDLIPRSYQCHKYNHKCSFYKICFREGDAWKDPVGSGYYVNREPHHEEESLQIITRLEASK